jgi:DNA-directed RNA polymerase subunit RPC12/RpoP
MEGLLRRINRLTISRNNQDSSSSDDEGVSKKKSKGVGVKNNVGVGKNKKQFGYYKCDNCGRGWQSAHSWKEYAQKCKGCGEKVIAYRREDLIKSEDNKIDVLQPHIRSLCEKCKVVGDCTQYTQRDRY